MLGGIKASQVYIVCGYTDMRRSIDGLAAIVKQNYGMDPYNQSLFLFCGRRRDRIKGLLWDEDGFLLLYKRLNDGGSIPITIRSTVLFKLFCWSNYTSASSIFSHTPISVIISVIRLVFSAPKIAEYLHSPPAIATTRFAFAKSL